MNRITLSEKGIDIEIPSHWDEMNKNQLLFCMKQAVMCTSGIVSVDEAKVRCFYHLADIQRDYKSVAIEKVMSEEIVQEKNSKALLLAEQLCGFMFKENEQGQTEINYDTIYNHFPFLLSGKVKLHGPMHLFADLTFGEFRAAIEEMKEFFQSKENSDLNRMMACLYRPERSDYDKVKKRDDFDGSIREPFNRARIGINADYFKQVSHVVKTAILLWFTYMVDYIQKEDLVLGGEEVNFSGIFQGGESEGRRPAGSGWITVLHQVAKQGPFGDAEKTDKMGLFDVLLYMKDCHDQNEELKRKSRKK
ncbi:hypothetical protein GCM10027284_08820 [Cyclobacterium sediminis]